MTVMTLYDTQLQAGIDSRSCIIICAKDVNNGMFVREHGQDRRTAFVHGGVPRVGAIA